MSRPITRAAFRYLVKITEPRAAEARERRLAEEASAKQLKAQKAFIANLERHNISDPLEAAVAKFKADNQAAALAPKQLKVEDGVYISGSVLRERKDEAERSIRKARKDEVA